MIIHSDPQRSDAWHKLRRGIPTASDFDRIITPQGKRSGQARTYMCQLAYERLLNKDFSRPNLTTIPHVYHGMSHEDRAVEAFEQMSGYRTDKIGFITDDTQSVGCSPDRLIVGQNAALEVKCPQGHTQIGYLIYGRGDAYEPQIQGQMLIGGYDYVHFFSWTEEFPPYHCIVVPDYKFQTALALYLSEFDAELKRGVELIRKLGSWPRNTPSVFPEEDDDAPTAA